MYLLIVFVGILAAIKGETKIACQNTNLEIVCNGNTVINVIKANFGRTSGTVCTGPNRPVLTTNCVDDLSTSYIKKKCTGRQTCLIKATRDIFEDLCYGTFKYLEVEYECISDPDNFRHGLVCAHETLTISCEDKKTIRIAEANYGRTTESICKKGPIVTTHCVNTKSNAIASERCDGQTSCSLPAEPSVFGDPCFGTFKYLAVSYICI